MARYVTIASVLFPRDYLCGRRQVRREVLAHLTAVTASLEVLAADLVVFCEGVEALAQTTDQAEELREPGPVLKQYIGLAEARECYVAGSVKLREGRRVYNSIAFLGPGGQPLGAYHKCFLTDPELTQGLSPGSAAVALDTAIGRLGGVICFDLNFTEIRKQYVALRPDILAFASMYHGGLVQGAWAYDCRSFFVSALPFHGGGVLDPFGRVLAATDGYTTIARTRVNLDRAMVHLDFNRAKFIDIQRRYGNEVSIDIPAHIGAALIYSHSDRRSAMDVVREFDLVLLDDYLRRSANNNRRQRGDAAGPTDQCVTRLRRRRRRG